MSAIPNRYGVDRDAVLKMYDIKRDIVWYIDHMVEYDDYSKRSVLGQLERLLQMLARIY